MVRRAVVLLICLIAGMTALQATVIVPIEFRELVARAPIIVRGRVVNVTTQWTDGRRGVETLVTLEASEYLKGTFGSTVTFKVPGGQLGRYRTIFVGAPSFAVGDEVVLFLNQAGASYPFVFGLSQGVFRVVDDPSSGRRLVMPPTIVAPGTGVAQPIVRGDPARRPMPVDGFLGAVRQVLHDQAGAK